MKSWFQASNPNARALCVYIYTYIYTYINTPEPVYVYTTLAGSRRTRELLNRIGELPWWAWESVEQYQPMC
jgi:hypothetical protein